MATGTVEQASNAPETEVSYACALTTDGEVRCFGRCAGCEAALDDVPTDSGYVDVAASASAACALDVDGYVSCWGEVSSPVMSNVPSDAAVEIAAGAGSFCGLTPVGGIACWGDLGSVTPPNNGPYAGIELGKDHACALQATDRNLACWGPDMALDAISMVPSVAFQSFSLGLDVSVGVDYDGFVHAWGADSSDAAYAESFVFGDEAPADWTFAGTDQISCQVTPSDGVAEGAPESAPPVTSTGKPSVSNVSISSSSLLSGQVVTCDYVFTDPENDPDLSTIEWYQDSLSNSIGSGANITVPAYDPATPSVIACGVLPFDGSNYGDVIYSPWLSVGDGPPVISSLEINPDPAGNRDVLTCDWTANDPDGGALASVALTMTVNGNAPERQLYADLALTDYGGCVISASTGELMCWGAAALVNTAPSGRFSSIVGTDAHFCALDLDGLVTCFGNPPSPSGTNPSRPEPKVPLKQVAVANYYACGIDLFDEIRCWGEDPYPSTHILDDQASVFQGMPSGTFRKITSSNQGMCAISMDGVLSCWGYGPANYYDDVPTPMDAQASFGASGFGGTEWVDVAMAAVYFCALTETGDVFCNITSSYSGYDNGIVSKVLNDGSSTTYTSISANAAAFCGLRTNGRIRCLGNTAMENQAPNSSGWVQLQAAPYEYACAVDAAKNMDCWGNPWNDGFGQVLDLDANNISSYGLESIDDAGSMVVALALVIAWSAS